jgi:hypothetical protein
MAMQLSGAKRRRRLPAVNHNLRRRRVPTLDEFRNFCYSPQAALEPVISDIDRFSVAESYCMTGSTFPLG